MDNKAGLIGLDLNINEDFVAETVRNTARAAIVSAMGEPEKLIQSTVDHAIQKYVDEDGRTVHKDHYRARPYLSWLVDKSVTDAIRDAFCEMVEENREDFKKEIKKALCREKFKNEAASVFVNFLLNEAKSEYRMPVTISFKKE